MAIITDVEQTVTLVEPDGSRVDVIVAKGKHVLGKDPLQDRALEQLWGMHLLTDSDRPQIIADELAELVVDPTPAPAADVPTEG